MLADLTEPVTRSGDQVELSLERGRRRSGRFVVKADGALL